MEAGGEGGGVQVPRVRAFYCHVPYLPVLLGKQEVGLFRAELDAVSIRNCGLARPQLPKAKQPLGSLSCSLRATGPGETLLFLPPFKRPARCREY